MIDACLLAHYAPLYAAEKGITADEARVVLRFLPEWRGLLGGADGPLPLSRARAVAGVVMPDHDLVAVVGLGGVWERLARPGEADGYCAWCELPIPAGQNPCFHADACRALMHPADYPVGPTAVERRRIAESASDG